MQTTQINNLKNDSDYSTKDFTCKPLLTIEYVTSDLVTMGWKGCRCLCWGPFWSCGCHRGSPHQWISCTFPQCTLLRERCPWWQRCHWSLWSDLAKRSDVPQWGRRGCRCPYCTEDWTLMHTITFESKIRTSFLLLCKVWKLCLYPDIVLIYKLSCRAQFRGKCQSDVIWLQHT